MTVEGAEGISIELMGKKHKFICSAEQSEDLHKAASKLADMCDDIKLKSGSVNNERALLVAAINISYSLLMANNKIDSYQLGQDALISTLKSAL
ncbi:MAG: cell division protein ZapA [Colwellia sp.]|nr:cell division protein ZapA [Colwellia sp.]